MSAVWPCLHALRKCRGHSTEIAMEYIFVPLILISFFGALVLWAVAPFFVPKDYDDHE